MFLRLASLPAIESAGLKYGERDLLAAIFGVSNTATVVVVIHGGGTTTAQYTRLSSFPSDSRPEERFSGVSE